MQQKAFSDSDIDQIRLQYERQVRFSAALAELHAGAKETAPKRALRAGAPDLPPEPDFLTGLKIWGRYADEAIKHLGDSSRFLDPVLRTLSTPETMGQLQAMINSGTADPKLVGQIRDVAGDIPNYRSLQIGLCTSIGVGAGISGVTGIAIPLNASGKPKWFSGAEASAGITGGFDVTLMLGLKVEEPQKLTGQFYGVHLALEIGIACGGSLYLDTSDQFKYKGFSIMAGVGIGGSLALLRGFELVTSD